MPSSKRTWKKIKEGQRFGRLVVIHQSTPQGAKTTKWRCHCDCGNQVDVASGSLNRGVTVSCGCKKAEVLAQAGHENKTHGDTINKKSKEYRAWTHIKSRCYNPNVESYKYYGGRGITVHSDWIDSFETFLAHIGRCPDPSFSIDRIDNDKGYEPGNVRWASAKTQSNNQRRYNK